MILNWSWMFFIYFLLFKGLNGLILKQRTKTVKRDFSVTFLGISRTKTRKRRLFWVKMICREEWKQKGFLCFYVYFLFLPSLLSSLFSRKCLEFIRHWNPKTLNCQRSLHVTENSNWYRFFLSNAKIQSIIELKYKTTQLNTDRNYRFLIRNPLFWFLLFLNNI